MKRLQQLWAQAKVSYKKLPEIVRFLLTMLWMFAIWAIVTKLVEATWYQFDKIRWVQQVEPYFNKLIIYLPFAFIAVLFLLAFNRIAELLKK